MTESADRQSWLSRPLEIPEEALREMTEAGELALPYETGGLLFPEPLGSSWIHVLNNHSIDKTSGMLFDNQEVIDAGLKFARHPKDWERLTIWHTHPGGGIGPSRRDMKARIPQMGNLIIALVNGQGIPAWY